MERSSRTRSGCELGARASIASTPSDASPDDVEAAPARAAPRARRASGDGRRRRGRRSGHVALIGRSPLPIRGTCRRNRKGHVRGWLVGELLLVALLGSATALFLTNPALRNTLRAARGRLVLDTAVVLAATIVAILAGVRFAVEGRASTCSSPPASRRRRRHARVLRRPVLGGARPGRARGLGGDRCARARGDADRACAARSRAADRRAQARAPGRARRPDRRALVALWLPLRGFGARLSLLDSAGDGAAPSS